MRGDYDNIRIMAGDSQESATSAPWMTVRHAASVGASSQSFNHYPNVLFKFSAACFYFATQVTDLLRERYGTGATDGQSPPVLGLVSTAVGGSLIEEWDTNESTALCNATVPAKKAQLLYDQNVVPFLDMSLKGFVWVSARVPAVCLPTAFCTSHGDRY